MKTYSNSTLERCTKKELIDTIRRLEYNYNVVHEQLNDAIDVNTKLVKILNTNKIEWLKLNSNGRYEVLEYENK